MANRSSLRSSLTKVQDPMDLELTEVAKESFQSNGNKGSSDQLQGGASMFSYGSPDDDQSDDDDHLNNEESVIDILANVDDETAEEEHMVTREEDSLAKTLAGVAGNVLEWYDFAVFGYFSDILGDVFFPPDQGGHAAIVESFAVFGGAFFMRPRKSPV